jgi:hypothetical protein
MPKIVLVETVSTFRHMYAVEVADNDPIEYALDDVTMADAYTGEPGCLEDFAQNHIDESIFSYREITEDEYLKIFDKECAYLKEWTDEQKKRFIYKGEK